MEELRLKEAVREFLEILNTVEESSNGLEFHPVTIHSCRVMKTKRIGELIKIMIEEISE